MNIQPVTSAGVTPSATPAETNPGAGSRQAQAAQNSSSGIAVDPFKAVGSAERISKQQLEEAVKNVQSFVSTVNQNLEFSVDDDTGRTVIKVIDRQTEQILRQIPSEEMLQIAKALGKLDGLLIKQQA